MELQDYTALILATIGIVSLFIAFWEKIFNNGKKDENIVRRVCDLELSVKQTATDINTIKNNHLAHMQTDINGINVKMERIETTLEFIKNK